MDGLIISKVKSLVFSQTSRDSSVLLFGTVVSTVLNLVLVVLLTRNLTVAEYGLFVTGLTFIQLLADVSDLGVNSSILNFLPGSQGREKQAVIKATFNLKLLSGIFLGILVFLLAGWIAEVLFKSEAMVSVIQASSLGTLLLMLIFWGQNIFQGERKFFSSMVANTSINVLRTSVVFVLILIGTKSLTGLFFGSQIVLALSVGYVFWKLGAGFFREKITSGDYLKILKFGLPIGGGFALAAVYTKLDQILVLSLGGAREAGIYGLALKLATFFVFAGSAFSSAFVPRFSSIDRSEFRAYFRKTVLMSIALGLLPLLAIPLSALLIPLIFPKFSDSIASFQVLSVGMAMFILTSPFYSAIIYRFKKPHFSLILGIFSLVLVFGFLNLLIPRAGSVGAAVAVAATYFFQMVASLIYYLSLKNK